MKFHSAFLVAAAMLIASGCSCSGCASTLENGGGNGGGKGNNGSLDGGDGGGDGQGGGTGNSDGGDGVTTNQVGPGSFSLDGGSNGGASSGDGVKLDPNGYIVLNQNDVQLHYMWIANVSTGTVSKYDTRDGKEVGRYYSHFPTDGAGNPNNFSPADATYAHSPSRTAIDLYGDMWVANRAPDKQGSVTKIANGLGDCKDRNGNGQIDTSKDSNSDGKIDPSEMIIPTDWSNPAQFDECVLFTQKIGTNGPDVGARAIAISASIEGGAGHVWAGSYKDKQFYKLRATDGALQPVNSSGAMAVTLGWGAYGATVDSQQRLWAVYPGAALLALIDTTSGTLINDQIKPPTGFTATSSYGIGIDGKDRVWLPGMYAGAKAARYDHGPGVGAAIGTWTEFDFSAARSQIGTALGRPRGIAADDQGFVWMSTDYLNGGNAAQLIGFNQETGAVKQFQTGSGAVDFIDATDANTGTSIGVALDGDANIWVNNYSGNAMKIDRTTGAVLRTAQQSSGLYTYSDFTGYQLRKFTSPRGTYRHDFAGCGATTQWMSLEWAASAPTGTSVEVYIKVANTLAELNSQGIPRYGPLTTSPADLVALGIPNAPFARVEFVLKSNDGQTSPALMGFSLKSSCTFN